jgi:hypothetical protein
VSFRLRQNSGPLYEKGSERLLRHIIGTDEKEVIRQALVWREKNSGSLAKDF